MSGNVAHDLLEKSRTEDVNLVQDIVFPFLLLPDFILRGLEKAGFKKPSPIQLSAIPLARCGLDLIVQAKSGTGKTLVFTVTALESIKVKLKRLQVIILAPTREIALQITDVIKAVGCYLKGLKIGSFIGGMPMEIDKTTLSGCHIAVGAPGRVRHLIEQGIMDNSAVRLLVLDEADKLMEEVFLNDINYIFNKCSASKQTLACSATYTPELLEFVNQYMRTGRHVVPEGNAVPVLLGLRQFVYITNDHANSYARLRMKQEALFHLLATIRFDQAIIFTNYITRAESLCSSLVSQGWGAAYLTGKQIQQNRNETVARLKEHKARIVVATDIAARGLDASSINLVINLDTPLSGATYLHRMGRAGRFGSQGICVSIISEGQDCDKFCNILGQIGGTTMYVNIIPKNCIPDLWNINTDDLIKLYGTTKTNDDDQYSLTDQKNNFNQDITESNSSAEGSESGSAINASNETDTTPNADDLFSNKKHSPNRIKSIKNFPRERKFSHSLREQVEGPDSSDYEHLVHENLEPKQIISFSESNCKNSSSSSQNSYKSSDNFEDEGEEDRNLFSTTSSEVNTIEHTFENLNLNEEKSNVNNNNFTIRNSHSIFQPQPYFDRQLQTVNNYSEIQQDDWCFRIQMQIQNYVKYSQYFRHNSYDNNFYLINYQ